MAKKTASKNNRKRKKSRTNRVRLISYTLAALLVLAVGFIGYLLLFTGVPDQSKMQVHFDDGTILPTTSIDGVDVSSMTPAQARIAINEQVLRKSAEIAIQLQYTDRIDSLAAEAVGVYPNADDTIRTAMRQGREGGITQRKNAAASGTVQALTLSYTYDEALLEQNIRNAAQQMDTAPIEPEVSIGEDGKILIGDDGKPVIIEGKDGIELDVETFVDRVRAAVIDGSFGPVQMPGTPIIPTYNTEEIKAATELRSTFYTYFTNASDSGRAMNIKKMCSILSGRVVLPGEEFSVNDTAGDRTLANGWYMAHGYASGGLITEQVGGGICQVSSTLYAALLKADLTITSRRPHSMPVSYISMGFDATINTGGPDLKFKNETDSPIYLVFTIDESNGTANGVKKKLTVDIYGPPLADGMTVEIQSKQIESIEFDPLDVIYTLNPDLVRSGHNYYRYEAWKIYKDKDGNVLSSRRANTSVYPGNKPWVLDPLTPTPDPSASPGEGTPTPSTPTPST